MATKIVDSKGKPRWKARKYIWDAQTGSTREKTRTFSLKRDAEHWEAVERERHRRNRLQGGDIRMVDFVEARIPQIEYGLALHTAEVYRGHISRRIIPDLGDRKLDEVTPLVIEEMQVKWAQAGCSYSTINGTRSALSKIFKLALKERRIEVNPVLAAARPQVEAPKVETVVLSDAQIDDLLGRLENLHPVFRAYAAVAIFAGLRAGEVSALRAGDVDLERRTLHVRRSLATGGREIVQTPKSGKSRTVAISRRLQNELEPVLEGKKRNDQLFQHESKWLTQQRFLKRSTWNQLCQEIGADERFRFHDLRATAIVRWLRAGVSTAVVRDWAGHADLKTTTLYARIAGTDSAGAVALVDALDGADTS